MENTTNKRKMKEYQRQYYLKRKNGETKKAKLEKEERKKNNANTFYKVYGEFVIHFE